MPVLIEMDSSYMIVYKVWKIRFDRKREYGVNRWTGFDVSNE